MGQKFFKIILCCAVPLLLAACSSAPQEAVICTPEGKCTLAPKKATSRPYQIKGVWYYPQPHYEYEEDGVASFYGGGDVFHGRPTATGKIFDMNGVTAAHKTLPLPCVAVITNLENGREIMVEVNDRGPFVDGRIIDVSRRVAQLLGFEQKGTARVRVRTLVPESLALNGIEPATVMLADANALPPEVALAEAEVMPMQRPKVQKKIKAIPRLPDSFFEDIEAEAVVVEADPPPAVPMSLPSQKAEVPKTTGIFVHVGKYKSQEEALALSKRLNGFVNSLIQPVKNVGSRSYAVELGPLLSMSQANQVLDQLMNAGHLMSRIVIHR